MNQKKSTLIDKILKKIDSEDLISKILTNLSNPEINSFILELLNQYCHKSEYHHLLRRYTHNRFVKPALYDPLDMLNCEHQLLSITKENGFIPLEISPVTLLGTCSLIAPVHQNNIVSASRQLEVVSDPTNVLALHICDLIKSEYNQISPKKRPLLNFSSSHQLTRAQKYDDPKLFAYFKACGLVTAGYDIGNYSFEKDQILNHIKTILDIINKMIAVDQIEISLFKTPGYESNPEFIKLIKTHLQENLSFKNLIFQQIKNGESSYYQGVQFDVNIKINDQMIEIANGGIVNWTQNLLNNPKERMITCGIGSQRILNLQKK